MSIVVDSVLHDLRKKFDEIHSLNSAIASATVAKGVNGAVMKADKIADLHDVIDTLKQDIHEHFVQDLANKKAQAIVQNARIYEVNNMFRRTLEATKLFQSKKSVSIESPVTPSVQLDFKNGVNLNMGS